MTVYVCPDCNHPRSVSFGTQGYRFSRECPHEKVWKPGARQAYEALIWFLMEW